MTEPVVITLGCRLNAFESEVMRRHALDAGLENAVIVNTCAVTGEAVRQAAQTIRKLRRDRPEAKIIVTGCAAQIEPERFAALAEADHVIGNAEKMRGETYLRLSLATQPRSEVGDIMGVTAPLDARIERMLSKTRAHVQIQNGCDHRCTFCIIPFARGPSRSVAMPSVVDQVRGLVDNGYAEIVLTGVDITSYGSDLPDMPALGTLVREILRQVPALRRLRLSSIDAVEVDDELMRALAEDERLMPHLHLSMQSGDDMTLKRMKRRHTRADAIAFCDRARTLRPDIVFGCDLIAGFPTETDEMFANSLDIVDACGLTYLHVFPYSTRQGTPAARMPQVPPQAIKRRANTLREKGRAALCSYLEQQRDRVVDALIENDGKGRTPQFAEVEFAGPRLPAGKVVRAKIIEAGPARLVGEVIA